MISFFHFYKQTDLAEKSVIKDLIETEAESEALKEELKRLQKESEELDQMEER